MPAPAPFAPWIALVAWAGLMAGVGWSQRPSAPQPLEGPARAATVSAWGATIGLAAAGPREGTNVPRLLIGARPCACDEAAIVRLAAWGRALGWSVVDLPAAPAGVALLDASGILRYAGEAGMLATSCAGADGLAAWVVAGRAGDAPATVVSAPCACA